MSAPKTQHTPGLDPRCACKSVPGRFLFCPMHEAAPDLLEACSEALERLENTRDGSSALAIQLRAAIAKARGQ